LHWWRVTAFRPPPPLYLHKGKQILEDFKEKSGSGGVQKAPERLQASAFEANRGLVLDHVEEKRPDFR
jgi:hypothetical protein